MAERRRSLGDIESMHVFTPDGRPVPLGEVVEFQTAESFASIRRLDRERIVTVTADVDQAATNPEEVVATLMGRREGVDPAKIRVFNSSSTAISAHEVRIYVR